MSDVSKVLEHLEQNTYIFSVSLLSNKNKKIKFRPFKSSEQKILAVDKAEAENDLAKLLLLTKILSICSINKETISLSDLTYQDFLWLLINVRMKSLGEREVLKTNCKYCDFDSNILTIDLEKDIITTDLTNLENEIVEVSKNLKFSIGHITVANMIDILSYDDDKDRELAILASMIKQIELNDEILEIEEIESKLEILDNLTQIQLEKFSKYLNDNQFGFKVITKYICGEKVNSQDILSSKKGCGKENEVIIEGSDLLVFF